MPPPFGKVIYGATYSYATCVLFRFGKIIYGATRGSRGSSCCLACGSGIGYGRVICTCRLQSRRPADHEEVLLWSNVILFTAAVVTIWGGSELVLRRVPRIAGGIGISPLTVTVLLVAVLTSMPELCVSMIASYRDQASAVMGNVVGSNLVTLTFVTAICVLRRPITVGETIRERESSWMILSAALLLILALDGDVSRTDAVILLAAYTPYFLSILRARRGGGEGVKREKLRPTDIVLFLVGLAMILAGAALVVRSGTSIARALGMSDLLIGITFYAFGTSLPELAIAFGATVKGHGDVSLGETYASNIFTGLVVVGLVALVRPLEVDNLTVELDLPLLVFSGVVLQIFITSGRKYVRAEALVMIALYVVFLAAHFFGFTLDFP